MPWAIRILRQASVRILFPRRTTITVTPEEIANAQQNIIYVMGVQGTSSAIARNRCMSRNIITAGGTTKRLYD
jgi:hypothetical protein